MNAIEQGVSADLACSVEGRTGSLILGTSRSPRAAARATATVATAKLTGAGDVD